MVSWRVAEVMRVKSRSGVRWLRAAHALARRGRRHQLRLGAVALGVVGGRRVARHVIGAHELEEVDAVDQLHREEPLVARRDQLMQRHQVRVHEVGQQAKLVLESIQRARFDPGQRLERDLHVALPVERLVDHAHAAGADLALDQEAPGVSQGRSRLGMGGRRH